MLVSWSGYLARCCAINLVPASKISGCKSNSWSWHRSFGALATGRLHILPRRAGVHVNHKQIYRLYRAVGLMVKRRRRRYGVAVERERLSLPSAPNQVWSMDFVFDALSTGRRIKCLTAVDDFTKEAVGILVDHGISGYRVTRALDEMARFRGYPKAIRTFQGPECTGKAPINELISATSN